MVHFVGAGPGALDLITVRGKNLLKKADIVIYAGSLVNPELLDYAVNAKKIYNSAKMTLEEIVEVLKDADKNGLEVVRLHTGEPSVYGAVREQMDELDKLSIAYDSCPGVTACFGAAAALNLEYTLPSVSQTLIITRMAGRTGVPDREKLSELAKHHASMAIYLSSSLLESVVKELYEAGYNEDDRCFLCYKVTWEDEKLIECTLGDLVSRAKSEGISNTAIVLVGGSISEFDHVRSRLYAPDFSTAFRNAKSDN